MINALRASGGCFCISPLRCEIITLWSPERDAALYVVLPRSRSLSRVSIGVFPRISVRAQTHRQAVRLAGRRTDRQTKRLSPPAPLARPRRRPLRSNTTRRGAPLHASTEAELACVFVRPAAASVSTVRWCHCSSATCTNCMETKYHHHHHHHHPVVVSVM